MTDLPFQQSPTSPYNFSYTMSEKSCSVFVRGDIHQTDRSNPNFGKIKDILALPRTDDEAELDRLADELIRLMTPITAVIDATGAIPEIVVRDGAIFYNGEQIHTVLSQRMLDVMNEDLPIDPWVKFTENLYSNPTQYSRTELYSWLEHSDMPITPDGCFLAWKMVREDYTDTHTGTMDNSPGQTVIMPGGRAAVDPDRDSTCSRGLHFCSKGYLSQFGSGPKGRVVILKINPADVVSIPSDAGDTKGRCWRYQVVGEIEPTEAQRVQWGISVIDADVNDWDEPEWDDEDAEDVDFEDRGLVVDDQKTSPFRRLRDFLRG